MTRRSALLWKLLLALFVACSLASVVAWFILLSTICTNPRSPVPATQHVVPYNCHGMTVFISYLQDTMLHWLLPVEALFIVLSLIAAAMVALAAIAVRVDVQIHVTEASGRNERPDHGRD